MPSSPGARSGTRELSLTPVRVALDAGPLAGEITGVGVFCANLLRGLAERDEIELSAYAVSSHPGLARDKLPAGVALATFRLPGRLANAAWSRLGWPPAERIASGAQLVHGTNFVVPPSRHLARVVTVHDMTAWRFPELVSPATQAYPVLVKRALATGAHVHTVSRYVADELVTLAGASPDQVHVVYGAPEVTDVPPVANQAGPADKPAPYILALGTVEPRKDYPTLVRAFAQVAREVPEVRLVIAGSQAWGQAALDAAIQASGLAGRIDILGYVTARIRAQLTAGALVLAYPSVYEGFGLVPLEAMAAGCPVVATNGGSLPEVLGDGAILVPVGDAVALASALRTILEDAGARHDLIAKGRARAAEFSWQLTVDNMVALYKDVLGG